MRAKEITSESAVDELKEKLPSLKKTDYDAIDELMQSICKKHKISGQKLHDMFVKKYKHTPDYWIKKYKNKLDESAGEIILYIGNKPITKYNNIYDAEKDMRHLQSKFPGKQYNLKQEVCKLTSVELEENQRQELGEIIRKVGSQYRLYSKSGKNLGTFPSKGGAEKHEREVEYFKHVKEGSTILKVNEKEIMDEFIEWTKKILGIKSNPKINWSHSTEEAQAGHHTGRHTEGSNEIWVYVKNRNLVDVMRTVFHEFVHVRQSEKGQIKHDSSYPGSPIERQADELAGKYIKIFGAKHPEIFQ